MRFEDMEIAEWIFLQYGGNLFISPRYMGIYHHLIRVVRKGTNG
jgi:hypothetical protein